VLHRHERAAEQALRGEPAHVRRGGGETLLKHTRGKPPRAAFGVVDAVELGQRGAKGFFAEHPGAGFERGDGHVGVKRRRRRD
jgi:hypothetical protein